MAKDGLTGTDEDLAPANLKVVRLHYAAFSSGDIDRILEGLDRTVAIAVRDERGADTGELIVGLEGARTFFEGIHAAVANLSVDVQVLRADGNRVLAQITLGGTFRESRRTGAIPAVHLFTVHDGLITEIRTHRPDWRRYDRAEEPGA